MCEEGVEELLFIRDKSSDLLSPFQEKQLKEVQAEVSAIKEELKKSWEQRLAEHESRVLEHEQKVEELRKDDQWEVVHQEEDWVVVEHEYYDERRVPADPQAKCSGDSRCNSTERTEPRRADAYGRTPTAAGDGKPPAADADDAADPYPIWRGPVRADPTQQRRWWPPTAEHQQRRWRIRELD